MSVVQKGEEKEGQVKLDAFFNIILVCCVIVPAKLMRFPRVKADGQGFYHCVSRVVDRRFIFHASGQPGPGRSVC